MFSKFIKKPFIKKEPGPGWPDSITMLLRDYYTPGTWVCPMQKKRPILGAAEVKEASGLWSLWPKRPGDHSVGRGADHSGKAMLTWVAEIARGGQKLNFLPKGRETRPTGNKKTGNIENYNDGL